MQTEFSFEVQLHITFYKDRGAGSFQNLAYKNVVGLIGLNIIMGPYWLGHNDTFRFSDGQSIFNTSYLTSRVTSLEQLSVAEFSGE